MIPEYDSDPISLYGSQIGTKPTQRSPCTPGQIPRPMLAKEYDPENPKRALPFPFMSQPKLDGFRCTAIRYGTMDNFTPRFHSRNGKELFPGKNIAALAKIILHRFHQITFLDGELYSHGKTFEQISSMVKNQSSPNQDGLFYHLYDVYTHRHAEFEQRRSVLARIREEVIKPQHAIQVVTTDIVTNAAGLAKHHATNVSKGYEGTMLRDPKSLYLPGERSPGLLKMKDWHDDEFKIVGITEGKGKNEGAAVIECSLPNGKTFSVTAQGPYPMKRQIYRKRESHIGRLLMVRYQNLTADGKPRFPEALRFADEKEP